ncbi:IclR family transcriptional regulator [Pseudonocardia spinosispora]|uniref:IclR family transcriptional regulator n=1 Tax=Pseudonocardia spinosispora TaxID=103441 RepID=UPI000686DE27|nr:IclR family transcriptional regulator [Pseudonocardia spinosispora]
MFSGNPSSLSRAIVILDVLGSPEVTGGDGLGVVQIARLLHREKSQVSRSLKALAEVGLVARDPETLRYRLGWRVFTLAAGAADQHLRALAPQVLRRLVSRLGERAHLSVLDGAGALTVLSHSPARSIQSVGWIGRCTPMHCTSAGRALLFEHTGAEIQALLDDAPPGEYGPNATTDLTEQLARLSAARELGYAATQEEFEADLVGVAAPVRDFRGHIVAALNISGPAFRLGRAMARAGNEVRTAADQLSRALTTAPPPNGHRPDDMRSSS